MANAYGFLPPVEVSAKTGQNVEKAFIAVARQLWRVNGGAPSGPDRPKEMKVQRNGSCCSLS